MAFLPRSRTPLLVPVLAGTLAFSSLGSIAAAQQAEPSGLHAIVSKLKIKLYGYIKVDASYDQTASSNGNFVRWVGNYDTDLGNTVGEDDGQFNVTARQTRLGVNIEGPGDDDLKTSARIEIDFYSGPAETSANLRGV